MKRLILISCIISSSFAILPFPFDALEKLFKPTKEQDSCNICVYSAEPGKFKPKCFLCLNVVYTSTLTTCVNATELPKNISFTQADCLVQNCEINYPTKKPLSHKEKRSIDDPQSLMSLQFLSPPDFHSESELPTKGSVEINGNLYNVIKNEKTVAMELFSEDEEPEYFAE